MSNIVRVNGADAIITVSDTVLLHSIIQATENDQNLSQLPDEFKDEAIKIMFDEAKEKQNQFNNGIDVSNKRPRVDLDSIPETMDCAQAECVEAEQ